MCIISLLIACTGAAAAPLLSMARWQADVGSLELHTSLVSLQPPPIRLDVTAAQQRVLGQVPSNFHSRKCYGHLACLGIEPLPLLPSALTR